MLYLNGIHITNTPNDDFIYYCMVWVSALCSPISVFMNPLRMDSADIKQAIALDANEVLVVYQRERESGGVLRRIQYGPTVFTPSADEW